MQEDELTRLYEQMQQKSAAERMDVLTQMTQEQVAAGDLSNTRMEEIYQMISPMLSEAQRARMQEVIRRLKS